MSQDVSLHRVTVAGLSGFTAWFEGMRVVIAANVDERAQIESVLTHAGINFQPFTPDEAGAPSLPGFRVMYTTDQAIDEAINDLDELFGEQYEPEQPVFTYRVGKVDLVFYITTKPECDDRYFITVGRLPRLFTGDELTTYANSLEDNKELMAVGIRFEAVFADSVHVSMPDTITLGKILPLIAGLCP